MTESQPSQSDRVSWRIVRGGEVVAEGQSELRGSPGDWELDLPMDVAQAGDTIEIDWPEVRFDD